MAATPSAPGPLWYVSRGSGIAALVLLAVVVGLGVAASCRWRTEGVPRFITSSVHRGLSWTLAAVLAVHVVTASLDSFAGISLRDGLVPFVTAYRTVWMGLGTLSVDVGAVVLVSSMLLRQIGYRTWRWLHWLGYACFPLALLHGLATGTDTRSTWSVLLAVSLLFGVVGLVAWRIVAPWPAQGTLRGAAVLGVGAAALVAMVWIQDGPLSAGWARAAGTPPELLGPPPDASIAELLPAGTHDPVSGSVQDIGGGSAELDLTDGRQPDVVMVLVADLPGPTVPPASAGLRVLHGPLLVCAATALVGATVEADCGTTHLSLHLVADDPAAVSGELVVSPSAAPAR
jgi:methionine sulfoxide reductase heme-binding subunit